jgi:hypothetical protein
MGTIKAFNYLTSCLPHLLTAATWFVPNETKDRQYFELVEGAGAMRRLAANRRQAY